MPVDSEGALPVRHVSVNQLIAYNMAFFRKASGLTQGQLGDLLGWSGASVSAAERSWDGKRVRKFDADEIVSIALALDTPVIGLLLPPADAGTAVRYLLDTSADQPDIARLLPMLTAAIEGDKPLHPAFWQRLIALGVGQYAGLRESAEDGSAQYLERARAEAESVLGDARSQAEQIIANARAHAESLVSAEIDGVRREADEALGRARREADEMLTKARRKSGQITSDARARAEALEQDAQERHREVMGSLVKSHEELVRRVRDLRDFEREFRRRLLAYLEGQLADLRSGSGSTLQTGPGSTLLPKLPSASGDDSE
jgi:cell division septum initiation protein DivIVA